MCKDELTIYFSKQQSRDQQITNHAAIQVVRLVMQRIPTKLQAMTHFLTSIELYHVYTAYLLWSMGMILLFVKIAHIDECVLCALNIQLIYVHLVLIHRLFPQGLSGHALSLCLFTRHSFP